MIGVIRKELFESFRIRKNLFSMCFAYTLTVILMFVFQEYFSYVLVFAGLLPFTGCIIFQNAIEQDEKSGFDLVLLTYPISKNEVIFSKYILNLAFMILTYILGLIPGYFYVYVLKIISLKEASLLWLAGIILSLFLQACFMFLLTWLGNRKGTIITVIVSIITLSTYIILDWNIDISLLLNMNLSFKFILGLFISIVSIILSYFGSLKIYTKRFS